jgi:hypothetical protein
LLPVAEMQKNDAEYICGVTGNAALAAFSQSLGSVSARDGIWLTGLATPTIGRIC